MGKGHAWPRLNHSHHTWFPNGHHPVPVQSQEEALGTAGTKYRKIRDRNIS